MPARRDIGRADFPADLTEFYAEHEGVGLESKGHHTIRMARLSEVTKIAWKDLGLSADPPHAGWASFSGYRIGFSDYGDEIVYVLSAPGIPAGSVLALGATELYGPAGGDQDGTQGALVLGASLGDWLERMRRFGTAADGLYGECGVPEWVADIVEAEIARLNPFSQRARMR